MKNEKIHQNCEGIKLGENTQAYLEQINQKTFEGTWKVLDDDNNQIDLLKVAQERQDYWAEFASHFEDIA